MRIPHILVGVGREVKGPHFREGSGDPHLPGRDETVGREVKDPHLREGREDPHLPDRAESGGPTSWMKVGAPTYHWEGIEGLHFRAERGDPHQIRRKVGPPLTRSKKVGSLLIFL